jgi:hypothetical protein
MRVRLYTKRSAIQARVLKSAVKILSNELQGLVKEHVVVHMVFMAKSVPV